MLEDMRTLGTFETIHSSPSACASFLPKRCLYCTMYLNHFSVSTFYHLPRACLLQ
jgi:hypothetical protein